MGAVVSEAVEHTNKVIVREFLEAFSRGDAQSVAEKMHSDGTWWVSGREAGVSGTYSPSQLADLITSVKGMYKRGALRIVPVGMIAEGRGVAVEAECHEELTDGRTYSNRFHFLIEVDGRKIRRVKEYMDTAHLRDIFLSGGGKT